MNTLHLLNESPFSSNVFKTALAFIHKQDGILLTGNAVYILQSNSSLLSQMSQSSIKIYALDEDIEARAITPLANDIKIINYSEFVMLCTEYNKVVTWS